MNAEQIKSIILDIAGNPESGALFDIAEAIAEAIAEQIDSEKPKR